jgi:arylsulfatase A-like enzyme
VDRSQQSGGSLFRPFLAATWLGLFALLLPARCVAAEAPKKRPNVLFLFTDDQRADTIRALGNGAIQTPNLDRLAESGFVFRNAYCMGGNIPAVCLPSRTMLLSGRSLFHLAGRKADAPSFPRSLNRAGYVTYHHGKRGNTPQQIQKEFAHNQYLKNDEKDRTGGYPGKEIADAAVQFLRDYKEDRPFFLYLAFANPHDPREVNREYRARYDDAKLPLPRNYLSLHPFNNGEMTVRDEKLAPWPRTPAVVRKHLADYYAVITYLDMEIGRILQALRDSGAHDNTLIVFSSDHGLALGSHGLMGKQNIYEDGMKVPLLFAGPGIPKGQSDALVYLYDVFPTVCELTGTPVPASIDGKSLAPVIRGKAAKVRDVMFLAYRDYQRSVREGDWKLIRYPAINKTQLFDLKADPDETKDLADEPGQADRVKALMDLLRQTQKQCDDPLPLTSARPADPTFTPPKGP